MRVNIPLASVELRNVDAPCDLRTELATDPPFTPELNQQRGLDSRCRMYTGRRGDRVRKALGARDYLQIAPGRHGYPGKGAALSEGSLTHAGQLRFDGA